MSRTPGAGLRVTVLLGAHVSIAGGLRHAPGRGRELGCRTIQIFTKNAAQWRTPPLDPDDVAAFRNNRYAEGIDPVVAHDSYLINLASPDPELLERSRRAFREEMERAAALDIPYLVFHPGAHRGTRDDAGDEARGLATVAESLDRLHEEADAPGLTVCLEITAGQGTSLGHRFEHLARIMEQARCGGRLGVCFDTCHAFAAGYDIRTEASYEAVLAEFDLLIGLDRLKVVHLNDAKSELGSRVDRHEHIGRGNLGLAPFRCLVNDPRLRGVPLILETPEGGEWHRRNLQKLHDLINLEKLRSLIE